MEDARAGRRAEAAGLWRGRDRLQCAWREREHPVPARRWSLRDGMASHPSARRTPRPQGTDSNVGLNSMGIQLTKAASGAKWATAGAGQP